jgi:hypothetical protein
MFDPPEATHASVDVARYFSYSKDGTLFSEKKGGINGGEALFTSV